MDEMGIVGCQRNYRFLGLLVWKLFGCPSSIPLCLGLIPWAGIASWRCTSIVVVCKMYLDGDMVCRMSLMIDVGDEVPFCTQPCYILSSEDFDILFLLLLLPSQKKGTLKLVGQIKVMVENQ